MNWKSTSAGYSGAAIALHWLAVVLIVATYCLMLFKGAYPKDSPGRNTMALWHYMLGLSVFVTVWVRLFVRLSGADPLIDPPLPKWQSILADTMHWALYLLMVALPLLGWATLSARGADIPFFGLHLPALVGKDKALADTLKTIHETGATVGYYLIGGHSVAALFHHYVTRDNTLRLMWPRRDRA
jgi:cytochrome b561